jgi:hypothetical protein
MFKCKLTLIDPPKVDTCAIWIADMKFGDPEILVLCTALRIFPKSLVNVIFTSGLSLLPHQLGGYIFPARVITPTLLSALLSVLRLKIRFTASDSAPKRVGVKSPFRVCSELSMLGISSAAEGDALSWSLRAAFLGTWEGRTRIRLRMPVAF